jgi:hypothetical protein
VQGFILVNGSNEGKNVRLFDNRNNDKYEAGVTIHLLQIISALLNIPIIMEVLNIYDDYTFHG